MATVTAISRKRTTLLPPILPTGVERMLGSLSFATKMALGTYDHRLVLQEQAGDTIATAVRGLNHAMIPQGIAGQYDSATQLLTREHVTTIEQAHLLAGAPVALGMQSVVAAANQLCDISPILAGMDLASGALAPSLTRAMNDAARMDTLANLASGFPLPAILIHRAPALVPPKEETPSIAPERRRRRLGRPRGSYRCGPELVISTYKLLAASGRYVTQEQLAYALGIDLRTLQNYLSPRGMGLGWPLEI